MIDVACHQVRDRVLGYAAFLAVADFRDRSSAPVPEVFFATVRQY